MDHIGTMSDRAGGENRRTAAAVEVGTVTSKIIPVVAYVFSTAICIRICTKVIPITINARGCSRAAVSADTDLF